MSRKRSLFDVLVEFIEELFDIVLDEILDVLF